MRTFNVIIERDPETGYFVGSIPGWPGAHSQGESIEELRKKLREVIEMLLEDGEPELESEFIGLQTIRVAKWQDPSRFSSRARWLRSWSDSGFVR